MSIADRIEEIVDNVDGLKEGSLMKRVISLGLLIPVIMGIVSLITGIVTYIMFIVNGGYSAQIRILKDENLNYFSRIKNAFSGSYVSLLRNKVTTWIILGLAIVYLILIIFSFYRMSEKGMRIAMIVDTILFAIPVIAAPTTVYLFYKGLNMPDEVLQNMDITVDSIRIALGAAFKIYIAFLLISVIGFWVLILIQEDLRTLVVNLALALLFNYICVPVVFWIIENIIPLFWAVLVAVIVILVCWGIFGKGSSGTSDEDQKVYDALNSLVDWHNKKRGN
ncbi:MAG: hypothetical protein E7296_10245 [Lachnospiraceae bacterium]|nr:hypothetical protein [Lachnospiraceae bacterium]